MIEFHPVYDLTAGYAYFHQHEPDIEEEETYTENADGETLSTALWGHPLSDVVNALIKAGIQIHHLNEFPFSPYNCFKGMIEREPGRYYMASAKYDIPLVYSILGKKV